MLFAETKVFGAYVIDLERRAMRGYFAAPGVRKSSRHTG